MSESLYLGKMRNNTVTCHKICHHYNYLVCILQLCPFCDRLTKMRICSTGGHCCYFWASSRNMGSAGDSSEERVWMGRENRNISLGLAEPDLLAAGLGCGKPQAEGSSISSWLGNCKAYSPQCETETDKQERIVWDGQGNEDFTKWGKAWEKFYLLRTRHYHKTDN